MTPNRVSLSKIFRKLNWRIKKEKEIVEEDEESSDKKTDLTLEKYL